MQAVDRLLMLVAVAALAGTSISPGRPRAPRLDLVSTPVNSGTPNGTELINWNATSDGAVAGLTWTTFTAGVGVGSFDLTLLVDGVATCTLNVPCTFTNPGGTGDLSTACSASIAAGQHVDLTITQFGICAFGSGAAISSFEWQN